MIDGLIEVLEKLQVDNITIYDVSGKSVITDKIIIGSVKSMLQLESVRRKIDDYMWKFKAVLKNPAEDWNGGWLIMDYGDVVINIFTDELRNFYDLDNLIKGENFNINEEKGHAISV